MHISERHQSPRLCHSPEEHQMDNSSSRLEARDLLVNGDPVGASGDAPLPCKTAEHQPGGVAPSENRLSAVIEHMPLLYLPNTKQLVSEDLSSDCKPIDDLCSPETCKTNPSLVAPSQVNAVSQNLSDEEDEQTHLTSEEMAEGLATKADISSFSSNSSEGTELSNTAVSVGDATENDENGFVEIALGPRNSFERSSQNSSLDSSIDDRSAVLPCMGAKPKKRGISEFLARGIFNRKSRDVPQAVPQSAPGWKLFGKVPPKPSPQKHPSEISEEYKSRQQTVQQCLSKATSSSSLHETVKKSDVDVASTTALILEQRPSGLPSKDPEEVLRHKLEYEQMVEAAKRKEQKAAKLKRKQLEKQRRLEDELSVSTSRKTRELWWNGIPSSVRGKVWKLAIGNDLNLTPELYEICLARAKDRIKLMREAAASGQYNSDTDSLCSFSDAVPSREGSLDLIRLDVSRTFPQLCIFQKGGPFNLPLQGLLGSYACYRPDVGYVQGMSFIAAVLLLNMEGDDAFICFSNLLNRPCQIAFFRLDEMLMKVYFDTYETFFKENLPKLFAHFKRLSITPDLYLIDWMFTLYAKSLPLDVASRVWDVFCRDGEEFLFRTALGILKLYEDTALGLDFIHLAQFLTKLPESMSCVELFKCIDRIHMSSDNGKFHQVLASFRETAES
ncbi:hypothetical protein CAPTEDRAFT_224494 [Capitella teleta]|uniref:Rab-GAP TBC domain-containing protein n=1 Tax=Capitella teleta TaxID=283909 RepID=R7U612_CAPTE|nr:hypothetical protein CAPTEDRAFT_224494 [Capitella teleta]|eukprot:ELU01805.1 hypothetical protein CAPTEDRAFT_224494 [Capitella teleta]